jgi:hypothetical protein
MKHCIDRPHHLSKWFRGPSKKSTCSGTCHYEQVPEQNNCSFRSLTTYYDHAKQIKNNSTFNLCLIELLKSAFVGKKQKVNQTVETWSYFFHKQLLSCTAVLKAPWILLLAFGFLLFKMGDNRELFHSYFNWDRDKEWILYLFEPHSLQLAFT